MFNSNMWPNSFTRYNASKSEWPWLWPSRSLKVKCDGLIWLSICGFLLIYMVTTCLSLTFHFIHRVQWRTLNLRKKIVKNRKPKISNIQSSTFVRTTQKTKQNKTKSWKNWKCIFFQKFKKRLGVWKPQLKFERNPLNRFWDNCDTDWHSQAELIIMSKIFGRRKQGSLQTVKVPTAACTRRHSEEVVLDSHKVKIKKDSLLLFSW